MIFDLKRVLESKKAFRRNLADRPLAEKLAMLDALRERALMIRKAGISMRDSTVQEARKNIEHPATGERLESGRSGRALL